jgi:hypothetical protein
MVRNGVYPRHIIAFNILFSRVFVVVPIVLYDRPEPEMILGNMQYHNFLFQLQYNGTRCSVTKKFSRISESLDRILKQPNPLSSLTHWWSNVPLSFLEEWHPSSKHFLVNPISGVFSQIGHQYCTCFIKKILFISWHVFKFIPSTLIPCKPWEDFRWSQHWQYLFVKGKGKAIHVTGRDGS